MYSETNLQYIFISLSYLGDLQLTSEIGLSTRIDLNLNFAKESDSSEKGFYFARIKSNLTKQNIIHYINFSFNFLIIIEIRF